MSESAITLGIVGACGRGASFKTACVAHPNVCIAAVCDTNTAELGQAAERLGAAETYGDYQEMLDKSRVDAVIVGTPMPLHVSQAIAALQRNIHVLSEVPAGVSMDECRQLVLACRKSHGIYMLAENYIYSKPNMIVGELIRRGLFGTPYYAEGEYIHELKELNEKTKWRRKWQTGINGITYPTHSLGPILQWMPGQRVTSVCCAGSGHHCRDVRGDHYENEDSVVVLGKMSAGGLVKIRVDMLSDRPHAMTNYQLQGTDGCYESARAEGEVGRIWLRSLSKDSQQWMPLDDLEKEFLPAMWRDANEAAKQAGHGGGDYFELLDFLDAVQGRRPPLLGIDAAMDMTLPGLASQQSILDGGRWLEVPDSRQWRDESCLPRQQLQMNWPARLQNQPPQVRLPDGYSLRNYQPSDQSQYAVLMEKAGFGLWDAQRIQQTFLHTLPEAFFVVEHRPSKTVVATALANHKPSELHPHGGELGWVAADPAHHGKGLGSAVCAAVVGTFLNKGYKDIYLLTDDFRLPAIHVYLKLGFEPLLFAPDMAARWKAIHAQLTAKATSRA